MAESPFVELSALADRWCVDTRNRRESTRRLCQRLGVRLVRLSWSRWLARLEDVVKVEREREVRRTRIVLPSQLYGLPSLRRQALRRAVR